MSENNDYIQLPPLKKDTPSDVVAFMWEYIKVPEDSREKVKNLLKDANENGVKLSHQAPTLYEWYHHKGEEYQEIFVSSPV